jgi:hypothetical protein
VKEQNYLGIYLSTDTATCVCLQSEGRDHKVLGCFSVTVEEQESQKPQEMARLIAAECAERFPEPVELQAVVALDCAMFMQHNVHSQFSDPKQIAATVKFDAEEALAMDVTDLVMAFKINSSDQNGSQITVFTAQKKQLSDILLALQANNIDPVAIEPDIHCLERFLGHNVPATGDDDSLFCLLSRRNGYFVGFSQSQQTLTSRTFLLSAAQNRNELLAREIPLTIALGAAFGKFGSVQICDSTDSVDFLQLGEELAIDAGTVDLAGAASDRMPADCEGPVEFAIAYGGALAGLQKTQTANFRSDFMPYQGKKMRIQKTIKLLGISVVVLMVAVGLYFQLQLMQKNKYRRQLRKKFEKQYAAVMFGRKPDSKSNPVTKLSNEYRRIKDVKSGQLSVTGEESISAKLTMVLEAFNRCAKQTDLKVESISITAKAIRIVGDTSSRKNTLRFRKEIENSKLQILQDNLELKGGRDVFSITVAPKK